VVIWSRPLGESGQMTPTSDCWRRRSLIPCTLPVQTVLSVVRGPSSGIAQLTEPLSGFFSVSLCLRGCPDLFLLCDSATLPARSATHSVAGGREISGSAPESPNRPASSRARSASGLRRPSGSAPTSGEDYRPVAGALLTSASFSPHRPSRICALTPEPRTRASRTQHAPSSGTSAFAQMLRRDTTATQAVRGKPWHLNPLFPILVFM